ncbi:putative aliphatic sulfonates transport permease protein SsuC [Abditibacteriota bacterium]|nr:putative aliphatic sulfonates transport permease protein SsuC [Abditibacteriota bacterium]
MQVPTTKSEALAYAKSEVLTSIGADPTVFEGRRKKAKVFRLGGEISPILYWTIAAFMFGLVLELWCFLSYTGRVSPLILPTPTGVLSSAIRLWQAGELWPDIKISVFRIVAGFLASAVLAIPLGILIGAYKGVEAAQEPLNGFIRYIPVPALIPLVMVAAGIGEGAKVLLIFLGTYFQMVLIVADVTRLVPRDLLNASRTLGAKPHQVLFNVLLPATLPGLMETCRTMIGWAWTYLVIAEVVATDSGLGYRIMKAQRFLRTDEIFVGIVILGLLGLLTDLAFKFLQPRLLPWAEEGRNG